MATGIWPAGVRRSLFHSGLVAFSAARARRAAVRLSDPGKPPVLDFVGGRIGGAWRCRWAAGVGIVGLSPAGGAFPGGAWERENIHEPKTVGIGENRVFWQSGMVWMVKNSCVCQSGPKMIGKRECVHQSRRLRTAKRLSVH